MERKKSSIGELAPNNLCGKIAANILVFGKQSNVKGEVDKLLNRHEQLIHSERKRVVSHAQRQTKDWIINTLMLDGYTVPFRFKRKQSYRNLKGQYVNLTYYPKVEVIAGIEMEVMNVVRIRSS